MIVYCQLGFRKNLKGGQVIEVYINDYKINIDGSDGGSYLTGVSSRRTNMWYLKPLECQHGDVIRVECKTGLRELGPDEEKTFTAIFMVDENSCEDEFKFVEAGRGYGFPILKGKISPISVMTAKERRLAEGRAKLKGNENG